MDEVTGAQLIAESLKTQVSPFKNTKTTKFGNILKYKLTYQLYYVLKSNYAVSVKSVSKFICCCEV